MNRSLPPLFLALLLVPVLLSGPAVAVTPAWSVEKNVAAIYPSDDGSAIVARGDNLLYVTKSGTVAWSVMAYDSVDLTKDGSYVIAGGPHAVLYDRKGTKVWEIDSTGDSPSSGDPLHVQIARSGTLVLTWTSRNFHTWDNAGNLLGGNTAPAALPGDGGLTGAAVTPAGDKVIFFSEKGIFSFNRSGFPLHGNTDDWKCSVGILFPDGETVACGNENHIYLGYSSGTLFWDKSIADDTITSLAVSGGNDPLVAAASLDGKVYAFNTLGKVLWEYPLFSYNAGQKVMVSVSRDGSYTSASTLDPKTMKGAVFLIDRKGSLVWSMEDAGAAGVLDPDGDYLYVGTETGLSAYSIAALRAGPSQVTEAARRDDRRSGNEETATAAAPASPATPSLLASAEIPSDRTVPQPTQKSPLSPFLPVAACIALAMFITGNLKR